MVAFIGLIGFFGMIVGTVMLFKARRKNKKMKTSGIVILVSFIFFSIALALTPDEEVTSDDKKVEAEKVETAAPVVDKKEEVKETPEEKELREAKEEVERAAAELKAKNEAIAKAEAEQKAKDEAEAKAKEDAIPREHKAALSKAESYASMMHMSKAGIYDQLTSEHGEGFPAEAAQYAIDNIVWDWKANALEKAKSYAEMMSMSDSAIYDQLISEHGEKFTAEEAQYAIDNL